MELEDKIYIGKLIDEYAGLLTKKQLSAVTGYFLKDLSLTEIAENENVSRQAAYDLVNKSKQALITAEEKIGKLKLITEVQTLVMDLKLVCKDDALISKLNQILELLEVRNENGIIWKLK